MIYHSMDELDALFPNNCTILDAAIKTEDHLNSHYCIMASISGGSDSDIVLDLIEKLGYPEDVRVHYVWYDTSLEFAATKQHLEDLEHKYGITIERRPARKSIPRACKEHGVPFFSKAVSKNIHRLQEHGFQWEDEPYEELCGRYPGCESALRWWCNAWGEGSWFNIERAKWLKEFLMENPPDFQISQECCHYGKILPAQDAARELQANLNIIGVRKAEGGQRATAYKTCFTEATEDRIAQFRPLFWLSDQDKLEYEEHCGVTHSQCYTKYGLKRTGCACCPLGSRFEMELGAAQLYEPNLYRAAISVFWRSYQYTRAYRLFKRKMEYERRPKDRNQVALEGF